MPFLHAAGQRTLRPEQRGYAATARPQSTTDYRVSQLVGDVVLGEVTAVLTVRGAP